MKKLSLVLVLLCLCGICAVAGEMDVFVGYSFSNRNYDLEYILDDYSVVDLDGSITSKGFAFGFNALEIKETKKIGLFTRIGFSFPSKIHVKEKALGATAEYEYDTEDLYTNYKIMEFAFGPAIKLFSSENIKIYVNPCVTLRYETLETESDYVFDMFFGIGCVPCINFYFSENIYISGKIVADIDIFYSGEDKSNLRNSLFIQPNIGIGFVY